MLCDNACERDIDFCLHPAYIYNPSFEHPIILADSPGCPSYWPNGHNVILIKSQSDNYGGVVAADGNQLLVLSNGAYIKQSVTFTPGLTYLLTFSAIADTEGIMTVSVGHASLVVEHPLQSTTMATYSMRFVVDTATDEVIFTCDSGAIFLDFVTLQECKHIPYLRNNFV